MQIQVRATVQEDHEAIFRIESNPLVRRQQYPWQWGMTYPIWRWWHFGPGAVRIGYVYSTIVQDDVIVGSISYYGVGTTTEAESRCGWNLDPDCWGRGIMPMALRSWLERHFTDTGSQGVVADCFHNNVRCRRVLEKLHFRQVPVGLFERIMTMARTNCGRWIVRYRMSRADWEEAKAR